MIPYLRGLVDLRYVEINSKKYVYIIDYNSNETGGRNENLLHLIRCEKHTVAGVETDDIIAYFDFGGNFHKYIDLNNTDNLNPIWKCLL